MYEYSPENFLRFQEYLLEEEKSQATIEKYLRDVRHFFSFLKERTISKEETIAYKKYLSKHYAPSSVNSMLVSLNQFLRFIGEETSCVKLLRIQRQIFASEDRELTRHEYQRLVRAAGDTRLALSLIHI